MCSQQVSRTDSTGLRTLANLAFNFGGAWLTDGARDELWNPIVMSNKLFKQGIGFNRTRLPATSISSSSTNLLLIFVDSPSWYMPSLIRRSRLDLYIHRNKTKNWNFVVMIPVPARKNKIQKKWLSLLPRFAFSLLETLLSIFCVDGVLYGSKLFEGFASCEGRQRKHVCGGICGGRPRGSAELSAKGMTALPWYVARLLRSNRFASSFFKRREKHFHIGYWSSSSSSSSASSISSPLLLRPSIPFNHFVEQETLLLLGKRRGKRTFGRAAALGQWTSTNIHVRVLHWMMTTFALF